METAIRLSSQSAQERQEFILLDIVNSSLSLNEVSSTSHGRVDYRETASYSKVPQFAAFDWSRTSSQLIAFGHVSGSASLIRLHPGVQTSETIATYRVKQQRRCNSIAFNAQNWLAVALDKTRADLCLNIYDAGSTSLEPVKRLCPAELVSSVRFFAKQPQEVLVGAQRAFIRLYDLRDGFGGSPGNVQVATRNVNNIAIDPTDENYFAAGGSTDDPSVTVWDKRWLSHGARMADSAAMLSIKASSNASARTSIWSIRFSGHRRGQFAMCSSIGELRLVNLLENKVLSSLKQDYVPTNTFGGQPWSNGSCVSSSRTLAYPSQDERRGQPYAQRVVSFDWLRDSDSATSPSIISLRADKTVQLISCRTSPVVSLSTQARFTTASRDVEIYEPSKSTTVERTTSVASTVDSGPVAPDQLPFRLAAQGTVLSKSSQNIAIGKVLASTRSMQDRCALGYLFDCKKNSLIVRNNPALAQLWDTVGQLRVLAEDDGMVYDSADLAYVGVHGIWSEIFGSSPQRRLSPSPTKPADAIIGLNEKREIPPFEGERTDYAEHRQLCLAVCGWKFTQDALEEECQELIDRGLHYQAIIQAVLHGAKHVALNLLRSLIRSKTIANIGLGALLAADHLNDDQREMTRWMAADTDDTALKALLAYLESGDWRDVMKTPYLNLGYRLALGLRYLNDTELNGFIQSETARALKNGDPEGIILTGLTEQSMELFQTYITRTGDVQTAVLATAFTNPLYVDDPRWEMWKEAYFLQMQSWRAFVERTKFVVEHNRLSRTREGRCIVEPTAVQAKIRCVHCHSEIRRPLPHEAVKTPNTPAANAGTVCLKCGRHLPRCSVCTLWLGAPDPRRVKPATKNSKSSSTGLAEKMLVFCTKCGHGSHAHHAQEWFAKFSVCPSPGCGCGCSNEPLSQGYSLADLFKRL